MWRRRHGRRLKRPPVRVLPHATRADFQRSPRSFLGYLPGDEISVGSQTTASPPSLSTATPPSLRQSRSPTLSSPLAVLPLALIPPWPLSLELVARRRSGGLAGRSSASVDDHPHGPPPTRALPLLLPRLPRAARGGSSASSLALASSSPPCFAPMAAHPPPPLLQITPRMKTAVHDSVSRFIFSVRVALFSISCGVLNFLVLAVSFLFCVLFVSVN